MTSPTRQDLLTQAARRAHDTIVELLKSTRVPMGEEHSNPLTIVKNELERALAEYAFFGCSRCGRAHQDTKLVTVIELANVHAHDVEQDMHASMTGRKLRLCFDCLQFLGSSFKLLAESHRL